MFFAAVTFYKNENRANVILQLSMASEISNDENILGEPKNAPFTMQ